MSRRDRQPAFLGSKTPEPYSSGSPYTRRRHFSDHLDDSAKQLYAINAWLPNHFLSTAVTILHITVHIGRWEPKHPLHSYICNSSD